MSKLTQKQVEKRFKQYGYTILKYTDARTKMKVRDDINDTIEEITVNKLKDKIRLTKRQITKEAVQHGKLKEAEKFIGTHKLSISKDQVKMHEFYQDIKEEMKTNKDIAIGKVSGDEFAVLAVALKEFAAKYKGTLLIKTLDKRGAINYVRVNPTTINDLLNIMDESYDQVRDSFDNFAFSVLDNVRMDVILEPSQITHERPKIKNGEFFPYYNRSELDLEIYDIYRDTVKNTCCLLQEFDYSKVLTENDMNLLKSSIHS